MKRNAPRARAPEVKKVKRESPLVLALETHIIQDGLPRPLKEFVFHDTRRWRFDMAWPLYRLAVECDGGVWANGRHTRGSGFEGDCYKMNEAVILGWRVLRVTSKMIESGEAVAWVAKMLGKQLK